MLSRIKSVYPFNPFHACQSFLAALFLSLKDHLYDIKPDPGAVTAELGACQKGRILAPFPSRPTESESELEQEPEVIAVQTSV